jgi:hypothetical protein
MAEDLIEFVDKNGQPVYMTLEKFLANYDIEDLPDYKRGLANGFPECCITFFVVAQLALGMDLAPRFGFLTDGSGEGWIPCHKCKANPPEGYTWYAFADIPSEPG